VHMPSPPMRTRLLAGRIRALAVAGLVAGAMLAIPTTGAAAPRASVPCSGAKGGANGLIAAIKRANAGGGRVELAPGCAYRLSKGSFSNQNGPVGLPVIDSAVTIDGHGSSIIRAKGAPQFRLLELESKSSASLTLKRLALKNGEVTTAPVNDNGGAILLGSEGTLVVRHSKLASNSAVNGGAIDASGASVRIVHSVLRSNEATGPDAVAGAVEGIDGPVTIHDSVISGNRSVAGGGGVSGQTTEGKPSLLKITGSKLSNNVVTLENGGGGIFAFGRERLIIRRSTIAHNRYTGIGEAGAGGGILNRGRMTITDSTITANVAGTKGTGGSAGGAIFNTSGGTGTISGTTIAGNRSQGPGASGGGIANGSALNLTATIVAENEGGNCAGHVRDGGFNLENGASCGFVKHAVRGNPMLVPLAANGGLTKTMALKRQSPAINRVSAKNDACRGTTDQRRVPRPEGGSCDIGAFEVVATRTRLRVKQVSKRGNRIRLTARVRPRFPIPGQPTGKVVFRRSGHFLGAQRLGGDQPDTASIKARVSGGKPKLTASYKGSKLFLPSSS
jgi:hypothetical protein